ncbi:MAG: bifunctional 5,10-methylene-tetrahydrofolate dehydrogenase/5,10-methylene-tetrahydrofolate cyclohydrolase [Clostridiales bacterium]|nr:bifunctional 5,10-methylene-tetrahydrofolate dehydrogenase/5,10-methylene-tetrahydrofolate cyclohydrolase [Clostridiales bacterium]MCF8021181.1 bifunctional 5,10-methylene-tetrahydrofolate dehydrogenase/5,10-methylene-tetrahydrofolate cyclohydrolase [Clostridiales bacterium]
MSAKVISGKEVAQQIRSEIKVEVDQLKEKHNAVPGLVTILVGENPASVSYVTGKTNTAKELGYNSIQDTQSEDITEEQLLALVDKYNKDDSIHGVLVQLPLPKHIDSSKVLNAIDPDKDVDGFHPVNVGRLVVGEALFKPCTPAGIQELLVRGGAQVSGAEVVVVGRSNIVGKPITNMLFQKGEGANATVTVVHTGTKDMSAHTKRADILIVAAGKPKAITADMVKEGAAVIDVGVNRVGTTPEGKAKLNGDVDYENVKEKASLITPVPGGVGPMTITMLMKNTLVSYKNSLGL